MEVYELLKDAVSIARKADNIELYKQLLDISSAALEQQNKINQLILENEKLRNELKQKMEIVRHNDGPYLTLQDDDLNIEYCSTCWGTGQKLIQFAHGKCPVCHTLRRKSETSLYI